MKNNLARFRSKRLRRLCDTYGLRRLDTARHCIPGRVAEFCDA